ncbi:MAG: hypothetical protein HGA45_38275 [Chloroflexales bacterium]|nr:hypothetical protein [Chloroflexales bacterium]
MSNTKRFFPFVTLVGLFIICAFLATTLVQQNQIQLFFLLFLIGLMFWISSLGGGWRRADKDTVVLVEDFTHTVRAYENGNYLYIPIVNTIEAKMPSYPLYHSFEVESIDTLTPKIAKIKKITVSVAYRITDFMVCFDKSDDIKQMIKDLEQSEKLTTDNPTLWIKALNQLMEGVIAEAIRSAVWSWATIVAQNADWQLETPFQRSSDVEHDPYALSLNRNKLSQKVVDEVRRLALKWGLVVKGLSFENVELDQQIIDRATRNKDGEIAEARHLAMKEAEAIRMTGDAEAEVRAKMIARIIEALVSDSRVPITEQVIYNVVRAAMYSDGKMIWHAPLEKGANGSGSVKAA